MSYDEYCICGIKEIKEAEKRNWWSRFTFWEHRKYLVHKLIGHEIVRIQDCSPVGFIEHCSCGESFAS